MALHRAGHLEAACEHYRDALREDGPSARLYFNLGTAEGDAGRLEAAADWYRRALELDPGDENSLAGLAAICERQGNVALAFDILSLRLGPDSAYAGNPLANANLALVYSRLCRSGGRSLEAIAVVESQLQAGRLQPPEKKAFLFLLGELYDRQGENAKAFRCFAEANRLQAAEFDPALHSRQVDGLTELFSRGRLARAPRSGSAAEPIFIVGMPRSGTSLAEQVLAGHPEVLGCGELDLIDRLVQGLRAAPGAAIRLGNELSSLRAGALDELAQLYLDRAGRPEARLFTDKMPQNFYHLGFISLLFPRAKIVHCVRDRLDTCFSCFTQLFASGHSYSYDLVHLGRYYLDYWRLMDHWRRVLPLQIFDLQYETLATCPRKTARSLLDFCGLSWDEECLHPERRQRVVKTASYAQARQPIYTAAIGRSRAYLPHLTPLISALDRTI